MNTTDEHTTATRERFAVLLADDADALEMWIKTGQVPDGGGNRMLVRDLRAASQTVTVLATALRELRDACLVADAAEELSGYVDGSLLDAATAALRYAERPEGEQ